MWGCNQGVTAALQFRFGDLEGRQRRPGASLIQWYAQDAVAAETWLQQSPLDEEARSRVREIPKQEERKRRTPRGARRPFAGPGPR